MVVRANDRDATGHGGDEAVESIISRIGEIAVLPHVVFKVLELSGSSDSSAADLERVITVDPAFSTKILTHANSSFYGLARKVTSIRDAVVYLGYRSVREIAMTVGVFDMFVGKNDKESLRRRSWWRQSLDTAIACRHISEMCGKLDSAEAYTCGLLHYIGKTLLDRFGKGDFQVVEQRMVLGTSEKEAERRVFGCDHEQIAVRAAQKWGLPAPFVAAFQYTDPPARLDENARYSACVALGHSIAVLAINGGGGYEDLPIWAMEELQIDPSSARDLYDHAIMKIGESAGMQL